MKAGDNVDDIKNTTTNLENDKEQKYKPIVFVNTPISGESFDVIGFDSQVQTLKTAIGNGANMIGIIADYGTGKSSMTELLCKSFDTSKSIKPIKINMWDCLSQSTTSADKINENVSNLTKSFLYQLSNGKDRKFGSYINKILSKNYGNISFATNKTQVFFRWIVLSATCFSIYKILGITNTGVMKYLWDWCKVVASFLKLCSPLFLLISAIFLFAGIKDICIAFSYWNMPHKREPEINDVFDTYNMIIEGLKTEKCKQLVFIDDLDRINEKETIIEFLKELYRFQESLGDARENFVFIISIKPESELENLAEKGIKKATHSPEDDNKEEVKNTNIIKEDKIYSKVFDVILSLKPIHFDDYDSVLLRLIKTDTNKMNELSRMLNNFIFEKNLPESFKWIKKGTNLTLRDLKDRLNQTIATFVSLKNKTYKVKTSVQFEACAATAFLENQYSKDYYALIKDETSFANFMKRSYKIINDVDAEKILNELVKLFDEVFDKNKYSYDFITDFCSMVACRIFNDDFRMYFYTYPKDSHIKTTEERELCDMLLYPNQNSNFKELDENVDRAYANGENDVVKDVLKSLDTYSKVVIMNDMLFKQATSVSFNKTFDVFEKNVIDVLEAEYDIALFWSKITILDLSERKRFIKKCIEKIISMGNSATVIQNRKDIIRGIGDGVEDFVDLFISKSEFVPQITADEINLIPNPKTSIKLINIEKLDENNADYIINLINRISLVENQPLLEKACEIMSICAKILSPNSIVNELLKFMSTNHLKNDDLFSVVCKADVESSKFVEYINSFKPDEFSDEYLKLINDKGLITNINNTLIMHLMERQLFYTPILYLTENLQLNRIAPYLTSKDLIIDACDRINKMSIEKFLIVRNYCYFECENKEYDVLFFSKFPIITREEYALVKTTSEAIDLIDVSNITIENSMSILEMIYSRDYSNDEIIELFEHLFDENTNKNCVIVQDVRKELINNFDFIAIAFSRLSKEERSNVYKIIEVDCNIENSSDAIMLSKRFGCFVPELEEIIQSDSNKTKEYLELIALLDELSELALQWLDNSGEYITIGLSEKLCRTLYDNGFFTDYIVADCLRKQDMIINETIQFSNYISVYKNVEEMFDIMSNHWEFLEKLQQEANLEELDKKLLVPIFKTEQSKRFFEYIFSDKIELSLKEQYLRYFGHFKTESDSKAFQVLMCKDENMELLGDYKLYSRIHERLWSSNPTHKMLFTKAWNIRWKKELEEKALVTLD